jgi:hypothetical protein
MINVVIFLINVRLEEAFQSITRHHQGEIYIIMESLKTTGMPLGFVHYQQQVCSTILHFILSSQ